MLQYIDDFKDITEIFCVFLNIDWIDQLQRLSFKTKEMKNIKIVFKMLSDNYRSIQFLESIDVSCICIILLLIIACNIVDADLDTLSSNFNFLPNLKAINLEDNKISAKGIEIFCNKFILMPKLQTLILNNSISLFLLNIR